MRAADSKKILTDKERRAVYRPLLSSSNKWNLPHLAIRKMHKIFLSTKIVPNTYHRAESSLRNAAICADVSSRKKRSSGKRGLTENDRQSMIRSNQQRQRSTIRLLVLAISFPWSTLQDAKTKKNARRHSSAVKIGLTRKSKKKRLRYAFSIRDPTEKQESYFMAFSNLFMLMRGAFIWFTWNKIFISKRTFFR